MAWKKDEEYFGRTVELSVQALKRGNDAFASLLVDEDGNILLEQIDTVNDDGDVTAHDTMMLVRAAVKEFQPEKLSRCTVYALMEPCIMCMGAMYWAGITRLRYAFDEAEYGLMRGGGGITLHSREFAARSGRSFDIQGPCPAVQDDVLMVLHAHIRNKATALK